MDEYEAVNEGYYSRAEVSVIPEPSGVEELVTAYLSNNQSFGIPSNSYLRVVIDGAHKVGLSNKYIQMLESWKNGYPLK